LNKYEALFIDEDDVFLGSPKKKFFDIMYNANRNLVEDKIDTLLAQMVVMEDLLEEQGITYDQIKNKVYQKTVEDKDFEDKKTSMYIQLTGEIVTQNE
jgi:hypothetical protein